MMIALGIDPGLTGAASLVGPRGLLECADLPVCNNGTASGSMRNWLDVAALHDLLADWAARHDFAGSAVVTVLERPIPMPSLPAQTIASQFDTVGAIRGVLAARTWGRRVEMVNPQTWKKAFGLRDDKAESRACALRLYPTAPITLAKHHNRAEAVLLAHWGRGELA